MINDLFTHFHCLFKGKIMKEINKTDIIIDIEMANSNIYMLLLRTKQMYEDTKKKGK